MTISFSGLGSGLDYSTWIDELVSIREASVTKLEQKNSTLQQKVNSIDTLQSAYSNLNTALQKLTDARIFTDNVFSKTKASSSNSEYVSAKSDTNTPEQSISVDISQLATSTILQSSGSTSGRIESDSLYGDIAAGNVKEGSVVFNIGNKKLKVEISKDDTLQQIADKFITAAESAGKALDVSIENGKFKFSSDETLAFTSAGTSDFVETMQLKMNEQGYESMSEISVINANKPLVSNESGLLGIQEGKFYIGDAEFTIDANTTMNSLINDINKNADAGVSATFDAATGKLKLTSKTTGELYISIGADSQENGGTNFTDVMGLTVNGSMTVDNQNIGQNAIFNVNGKDIEYFSNTVPASVSGVSGVTLTLNKVPPVDFEDQVTVDITQDTDELIEALSGFVDAYNEIINKTKSLTEVSYSVEDGETVYTKGVLAFDSQVTSMLSQLKSFVTGEQRSDAADNELNMLSQLGIATPSAGASLTTNTNLLEFDKEKFLEAFNENPDGVKDFLIGNLDDGIQGLLGAMSETIDSFLDIESGYFATKTDTLKSQMSTYTEKIALEQDRIESYRASLEKQFLAMDTAISQMNSQFSSISSILSSISGSSS